MAARNGRLRLAPWAAAAFFSSAIGGFAADRTVCEMEMSRAAGLNDIPINVLYAVGLVETGHRGVLRPFDINVDGLGVHSPDLAAALAAVARARQSGARLIDVGCMQINVRWHGDKFTSLADMFNARRNVEYAAGFLRELRRREGSWTLAVARYNAGPNNFGAQKEYVCRVIGQMVGSGMGNWTPAATRLCK